MFTQKKWYSTKIILLICLQFICTQSLFSQTEIDSAEQKKTLVFAVQLSLPTANIIIIPVTLGYAMGISAEKRISYYNFLGINYTSGYTGRYTIDETDLHRLLRIYNTQLYLYRNNPKLNIINQVGIAYTLTEELIRGQYMIFGDRMSSVGILFGNNNLHIFPKIKKLILTLNCSINVYNYRTNRKYVDTHINSYAHLSLKYMLSNSKKTKKKPIHKIKYAD